MCSSFGSQTVANSGDFRSYENVTVVTRAKREIIKSREACPFEAEKIWIKLQLAVAVIEVKCVSVLLKKMSICIFLVRPIFNIHSHDMGWSRCGRFLVPRVRHWLLKLLYIVTALLPAVCWWRLRRCTSV